MKRMAFFGHRIVAESEQVKRLVYQILKEKTQQGYREILVGSHGEFDKIVLLECLKYKREIDESLKITLVLTTLSTIGKRKDKNSQNDLFETLIYEIEQEYFKNRINFSNRKMIDDCELIVCYVDMNRGVSGAKKAVKYAIKKGKEIINLYKKTTIDDGKP